MTRLPSELSVRTFADWWKKSKSSVARKPPHEAYALLKGEVEDFLGDYR